MKKQTNKGKSKDKNIKKNTVKILLKYLLLAVISIVIAGLGEFMFLSKLIFLDESEKGITDGLSYTVSEDGSGVTVDVGGMYVNKLICNYDYSGKTDAVVYILAENAYGKESSYVKEDHCSTLLNSTVINMRKRVSQLNMVFDTSVDENSEKYTEPFNTSYITGFSVDNTVHINWYRCTFIFTACLIAGILITERKRLAKRVDIIFLVIALLTGTFVVFSLPTSKIGWDEEIHFMRSYSISVYPGAMELSQPASEWFVASEDTWPFNVPDSIEERKAYSDEINSECNFNKGQVEIGSGLNFPYTTGYLAQGLFIKIARKIGCPFTLVYQLGRLGNLIMYCIVMALAIRKLPCGKWIMAVIGLMPTTLFLACTYSYDATVIAFLSLAIAYFMRMLLIKDYKFKWGDYLIMGAAFCIGCLPKSVYAPIALLGLMLPKRIFKDNRQMLVAKGLMVLAAISMFGMNILPTIMSPQETGDLRGGETSEAGQMSYVLGQPFTYAKVLLNNIFRTLPEYFAGTATFGLIGHLKQSPFVYPIYGLICSVIFTDTVRDDDTNVDSLTWKHKGALFAVAAVIVALIWTALYISYTVPGSEDIQGVQGRYYIPVLFLVYIILNNNKIRNRVDRSWYNVCVGGVTAFILLGSVWQCIVQALCL